MKEESLDSQELDPSAGDAAEPSPVPAAREAPQIEERFRAIHAELQSLAHRMMRGQPGDHVLQTTALVNEAFLKLARDPDRTIQDDGHFLRLASRAMRQILVDHARSSAARKRSAEGSRIELDDLVLEFERRSGSLVALDAALERLEARDVQMVRLIELRFFAGRSIAESAQALDVSVRTANRIWNAARLILLEELENG